MGETIQLLRQRRYSTLSGFGNLTGLKQRGKAQHSPQKNKAVRYQNKTEFAGCFAWVLFIKMYF
jgi:hypothetical protein